MTGTRLAVLMTTFNRRAQTLRCLDTLRSAAAHAGITVDIFVVDDASTDGTAEHIRHSHPTARVIDGGDLYWCRGMHRAFAAALRTGYPHYLWLNDDTVLDADALHRLLACEALLRGRADQPLIVVGSTRDANGELSYGGERFPSRWRRFAVQPVPPGTTAQAIDSMNGNIVLVNAAAAARVGNLDPTFEHAMGDTDYALRARRLGVGLWLAPGHHGVCERNGIVGTFRDPALPLARRWRLMLARKGLPLRSWLHFCRRHGGRLWPAYFGWPYLRLLLSMPRR